METIPTDFDALVSSNSRTMINITGAGTYFFSSFFGRWEQLFFLVLPRMRREALFSGFVEIGRFEPLSVVGARE